MLAAAHASIKLDCDGGESALLLLVVLLPPPAAAARTQEEKAAAAAEGERREEHEPPREACGTKRDEALQVGGGVALEDCRAERVAAEWKGRVEILEERRALPSALARNPAGAVGANGRCGNTLERAGRVEVLEPHGFMRISAA